MQDDVLNLAFEVSRVTEEKISVLDSIMLRTQLLAVNARLEATHAGDVGRGFALVAREMGMIADEVNALSSQLRQEIAANTTRIELAGRQMTEQFRGQRYADLARNAVEIIDRNLYERSCDVRWWATDSAMVTAMEKPLPENFAYAAERLATILRSYTVYIDLWLADRHGDVVATGRADRYPRAVGHNVFGSAWFMQAMATKTGDDFAVCDITSNPVLDGAQVATYSTAIRRGGAADGEVIGVLGIFFDWRPQARDVVCGVALSPEERKDTRVMLLNNKCEIIASTDDDASLGDHFPLEIKGPSHFYRRGDRLVSYALTPGYETYAGLGWYGCIESKLAKGA